MKKTITVFNTIVFVLNSFGQISLTVMTQTQVGQLWLFLSQICPWTGYKVLLLDLSVLSTQLSMAMDSAWILMWL
jgi:hypothetical protein